MTDEVKMMILILCPCVLCCFCANLCMYQVFAKQSRGFLGLNAALSVAILSGQEQIWAGTSYLGALRDCLVGSRKSTLPRVAF